MGLTKTIEIDGKQVPFKASAAIPRIYRIKFHRDVYKDLAALEKAVGKNAEENSNLDMFSLEMFENIAYIMAKHADPSIPDTPEEWLDNFNTFSIYQVLPKIIELWGLNVQTDVQSKKNFAPLTARRQNLFSCFDAFSLGYRFEILTCLPSVWSMICSRKAETMNIHIVTLQVRMNSIISKGWREVLSWPQTE